MQERHPPQAKTQVGTALLYQDAETVSLLALLQTDQEAGTCPGSHSTSVGTRIQDPNHVPPQPVHYNAKEGADEKLALPSPPSQPNPAGLAERGRDPSPRGSDRMGRREGCGQLTSALKSLEGIGGRRAVECPPSASEQGRSGGTSWDIQEAPVQGGRLGAAGVSSVADVLEGD